MATRTSKERMKNRTKKQFKFFDAESVYKYNNIKYLHM